MIKELEYKTVLHYVEQIHFHHRYIFLISCWTGNNFIKSALESALESTSIQNIIVSIIYIFLFSLLIVQKYQNGLFLGMYPRAVNDPDNSPCRILVDFWLSYMHYTKRKKYNRVPLLNYISLWISFIYMRKALLTNRMNTCGFDGRWAVMTET